VDLICQQVIILQTLWLKIVNNDENIGITENLIEYIKNNTNIEKMY